MRKILSAIVLIGALASPALAAPKAAKGTNATHSTMGVVKSVDANQIVVTRKGRKSGDMTFALQPSTTRQGDLAPGANVSVRYKNEGSSHIATAVMVRPAKAAKTANSSKSTKH